MKISIWVLLLSVCVSADAATKIDPQQVAFFEKRVRPLLVKHCYECHARDAAQIKGGLLLDSHDGWVTGGDGGAVIVPNHPERSRLITAVRWDDDLQMPPKNKLTDAEVAVLAGWIKMGAPDPRHDTAPPIDRIGIDVESGRDFWAFAPLNAIEPPMTKRQDWAADPIDRYVLAALEAKGLEPVGDANRATLIRRVSFDLIGLPPTPAEIDAFVNDPSPLSQAMESLVDRLLASPRFGERWGRHWLDLARYAESIGRTRNYPFPVAWRYRDYVIKSFNDDVPYDRFIVEQLAGDLLPYETDAQRDRLRIATGFLALGSHDLNENNKAIFQMDVVDEMISVTTKSVLALTVGCARCHDHKFDPIAQRDYYALAGIFKSTALLNGYGNKQGGGNKLDTARFHRLAASNTPAVETAILETDRLVREIAGLKKKVNESRRKQNEIKRDKAIDGDERKQKIDQLKEHIDVMNREIKAANQQLSKSRKRKTDAAVALAVMGVRDAGAIADSRINIKGDPLDLAESVERGYLRVLANEHAPEIDDQFSGRLELAQWLTDPNAPAGALSSRVLVNRVWGHMFGRGLVRTVDNFGKMGERPTHPALLDYLADRFVADGWSVKKLIRAIALSRTYRLRAEHDERAITIDPDNTLLWRASRRRLEAEAIRDAVLAVSGELKLDPPIASPVFSYNIGETGNVADPDAAGYSHRGVYVPLVRSKLPPMYEVFDFPDPSEARGRRDVTTVAPQALYFMNSPFISKHAASAAKRVMAAEEDDVSRVRFAYRLALGREADADEIQRGASYVAGYETHVAGWTRLMHALFASAEFRYVN